MEVSCFVRCRVLRANGSSSCCSVWRRVRKHGGDGAGLAAILVSRDTAPCALLKYDMRSVLDLELLSESKGEWMDA